MLRNLFCNPFLYVELLKIDEERGIVGFIRSIK